MLIITFSLVSTEINANTINLTICSNLGFANKNYVTETSSDRVCGMSNAAVRSFNRRFNFDFSTALEF